MFASFIQAILCYNCGRKKLSFNPDAIKDVPLRQRRTLRDLANALHMLKTTLFRRLKEGRFRRHTNAIKFTLTEDNMKARVQFCIQMLDSQSIPDEPTFKSLWKKPKQAIAAEWAGLRIKAK